ncbi:MAG TPA: hypothetical protein VEY91_09765 [Candidatus Limnocylindria bacterium]|nr:hypothetical protein [Candidatus Limnocylindria bacterium]
MRSKTTPSPFPFLLAFALMLAATSVVPPSAVAQAPAPESLDDLAGPSSSRFT